MARTCILACVCLCAIILSCKKGGGPPLEGGAGAGGFGGGGAGGEGGAAAVGGFGGGGIGGAAGNGGMGGTMVCAPGTTLDCYSGPPGTAGVGACTVGTQTCNAEGTGYGACEGEVVPSDEVPTLPNEMPVDEDCDGMVDESA